MNQVAEEMKDILMHYGTPRHSGRYPWGSGENPYQRNGDFLSRVDELKGQGLSDTEIAKAMGLTTTQFRTQRSLAKDERRALEVERAKALQSDGYNPSEIARMMGYNSESSIRSLLNSDSEARMNQARVTAENLKRQVDEHGMIAISAGTERYLGVSREKLEEALYILELEGYNHFGGGVPQVTNKGQQTNIRVLCPPDTPYKEITRTYTDKNGEVHEKVTKVSSSIYDFDKVHPLEEVCDSISYDNGDSFQKGFHYPASMNSERIQVVYAEQGGTKKDGVIELRRGVNDLSLGDAHYAQVRILVDGTHYLKGMAMYADDLPDGVDVRFNTNKKEGTPVCGPKDNTVLKTIKKDPNNPFGSLIKEHGGQSFYDDPNGEFTDPKTGKKQSLSLINKRAEEGDWSDWDDKLPSQFLSKQSLKLIKNQLSLTMADAQAEYDEICSLTNPTVKKVLLQSFADDCDAAAVHLKAASLPRQKYKVILPITSMKDDEVYAPGYENGEKVALIRFPHGGTFEIPVLTVNNKQAEAKSKLGLAKDAVGINSKVAERLSGADFDGDTVMIVPTGKGVKITSTPPLKGLEGFDGKLEYGHDSTKTDPDGTVHYYRNGREFKPMKNTQTEMGIISNLITDMTLRGAKEEELAKAVRHSMVVIDAEKHGLDYKQSEKDNDIAYLKKTYQGTTDANGRYHEGAATLISRSKSQQEVLKRKGSPKWFYDYVNNSSRELAYWKKLVTDDFTEYSTFWKNQWRTWFQAQTTEIQEAYLNWEHQWEEFFNNQTTEMQEANTNWKTLWENWFYEYVNANTKEFTDWKNSIDKDFRDWWEAVKDLIDAKDVSAFADELVALKERTGKLEEFQNELTNTHSIHDSLDDSSDKAILDGNNEPIEGRRVTFVVEKGSDVGNELEDVKRRLLAIEQAFDGLANEFTVYQILTDGGTWLYVDNPDTARTEQLLDDKGDVIRGKTIFVTK